MPFASGQRLGPYEIVGLLGSGGMGEVYRARDPRARPRSCRWLSSGLWPMPDVSPPPFHTLPYGELMARVGALTNLRVVEDRAAATGYSLELGPFSGWKDLATW